MRHPHRQVEQRQSAAGLDAAIVHAARIMPIVRIPDEQRQVESATVELARGRSVPFLRAAFTIHEAQRFAPATVLCAAVGAG